jgi:hypothetical protein
MGRSDAWRVSGESGAGSRRRCGNGRRRNLVRIVRRGLKIARKREIGGRNVRCVMCVHRVPDGPEKEVADGEAVVDLVGGALAEDEAGAGLVRDVGKEFFGVKVC